MKKIVGVIFVLGLCFLPINVNGAVYGLSFGGKTFSYAPCTCTYGTVSYIIVGPPSKGLTLAYVNYSQGFSLYTLPLGRQIKGIYNPAITSLCWMGTAPYCTVYPTQGLIMPMVGSSL